MALVVEWEISVGTVDLMSKSHQMASQRRFFSSGDDKAPVPADSGYWSAGLWKLFAAMNVYSLFHILSTDSSFVHHFHRFHGLWRCTAHDSKIQPTESLDSEARWVNFLSPEVGYFLKIFSKIEEELLTVFLTSFILYSATFSEKEFHLIANETLDHLQEKIEVSSSSKGFSDTSHGNILVYCICLCKLFDDIISIWCGLRRSTEYFKGFMNFCISFVAKSGECFDVKVK